MNSQKEDRVQELMVNLPLSFGAVFIQDMLGGKSIDYISELTTNQEHENIDLLGSILFSLLILSKSDRREYVVGLSFLQDHLILGAVFSDKPRSLYGVEKINGRQIFQLFKSLNDLQRKLLILWQEFAIDSIDSDYELERMNEILLWITKDN